MTSITLLSHRTLRQKPSQRRLLCQLAELQAQMRDINQAVRKLTPAASGVNKPRFIGQKQ